MERKSGAGFVVKVLSQEIGESGLAVRVIVALNTMVGEGRCASMKEYQ